MVQRRARTLGTPHAGGGRVLVPGVLRLRSRVHHPARRFDRRLQILPLVRGRDEGAMSANEAPPADSAGDVMTAEEVALFLRMNVKTVYELAKAGNLPCWRLGKHFRFSRRAIVALLAQCKAAPHREGK